MEDIIESILGQEIFEHDDIAVDMRELAKRRHKSKGFINKYQIRMINPQIESPFWTPSIGTI